MNYENVIITILSTNSKLYTDIRETLDLRDDNIFLFDNPDSIRKLLLTLKVDMLIIDCCLEGTLNFLQEHPKACDYTIVLVDSKEDGENIQGVDSIFTKPISPYNLCQHLQSLLNIKNTKCKFNFNVLKSIYSNSSDAIYVLDEQFIIQYVNPVVLRITEYEEKDLLEQDISKIINHPKGKTFTLYSDYQTESKLITSQDKKSFVYLTVTAIFEKGRIKGYVGIFNDLAEKEKLAQEQTKELQLLLYREKYHSIQQDMAFAKQLKNIKNDLDHVVENQTFFQVYYKPMDILSGDTYGTAYIERGRYLLYIIDAMGKGLSASVTSIQSSAFINHALKKAQENVDIQFGKLLESYQEFIKDRLLENELVSAAFVYINEKKDRMEVASFGMPPILVQHYDGRVEELKTNNLPIMNFSSETTIDCYKFSDYSKIMIKSDGFEECQLKNSKRPYNTKIVKNFKNSYLASNFIQDFDKETKSNSDDLTMIMLTKLPKPQETLKDSLKNNIYEIDDFLENFEEQLTPFEIPIKEMVEIRFTLNELIINAIEHGNLGITYEEKQRLLDEERLDKEMDLLLEKDEIKDKKVKVHFNLINNNNQRILYFVIIDEGEGFEVDEFFKYLDFDKGKRLHGRGIIMTNSLNNGIFYNKKGNKASFLKILEG